VNGKEHTKRLVFDGVTADLDGVPDDGPTDLAAEIGNFKCFPG